MRNFYRRTRIREEFVPINEFPGYELSNWGRVINLRTDREMILSPTEHGDLTIGFTRDSKQHRYAVKVLVAKTFVNSEYISLVRVPARAFVKGESLDFNTPILLDGDKHNLYFENIVWRPRWFAWRYSYQFSHPKPWYEYGPVRDVDADITYESYMAAAIDNGILCVDIRKSIYDYTNRIVYPTYQRFEYVR
jgi:hypothetical protein